MTQTVSGGTTVGITAGPPASFTAAGYAALTFTLIGELTNISEFGREYAKVEHKPLASRQTVKKKGGFDDGAPTLTMACDEKDAGQLLLETARDSDSDYYLKVAPPNGAAIYLPVQVMSFKRTVSDRDNIIIVTAQVEITGTGQVIVKPS